MYIILHILPDFDVHNHIFFSAVRSGDVENFQQVLQKYTDQFEADKTFTLILRLHHNVIKTAIRRISLAYSRISLDDVAKKLRLESPADAEFIIAKVCMPCPLPFVGIEF